MIINERFHDAVTGEVTDIQREATPEELKRFKEIEAQKKAEEKEKLAKDAARQAVLDKLGLSADEVAALLG